MKLAIISDVHSNLHALNSVKDAAELEGADLVVCAGDIVGYGAFPNECCRIVRDLANRSVLGNHERAALTKVTTWMNPHAADAAIWTSENLSASSREFLETLTNGVRFKAGDASVAMFHGSPRSTEEYIYEEDASEALLGPEGTDVLVLGHTHVPFVKPIGKRLIVNPGAVGQPRDGDPRACYAVLDTSTGKCTIRRVDYDIVAAASAIEGAGLPGFLADRLFAGR